jgi:hypothetical protein
MKDALAPQDEDGSCRRAEKKILILRRAERPVSKDEPQAALNPLKGQGQALPYAHA